jgi:hypothetical protein
MTMTMMMMMNDMLTSSANTAATKLARLEAA